jgi:hypothetical protein
VAVSGITLTIIPSTFREQMTVTTTLRDRSGKLLGKVERSDTLYVWQQAALLLVMPWCYPDTVEEEMIYDLHRSTVLQFRQERLLDESVAAAQRGLGPPGSPTTPE